MSGCKRWVTLLDWSHPEKTWFPNSAASCTTHKTKVFLRLCAQSWPFVLSFPQRQGYGTSSQVGSGDIPGLLGLTHGSIQRFLQLDYLCYIQTGLLSQNKHFNDPNWSVCIISHPSGAVASTKDPLHPNTQLPAPSLNPWLKQKLRTQVKPATYS